MTFKVMPHALWGGQYSCGGGILLWSYYLLNYPSVQRTTSNFIDLFDFCQLDICRHPIHINLPKKWRKSLFSNHT